MEIRSSILVLFHACVRTYKDFNKPSEEVEATLKMGIRMIALVYLQKGTGIFKIGQSVIKMGLVQVLCP